jgi:hypothetical protein
MTPPSVPHAPDPAAPGAVQIDPFDRGSIADAPTRALGATGVLDCEIWSTDFRERLDEDDPLRAGFQAAPADGTAAAVERLGKLHNAALLVTTIDR